MDVNRSQTLTIRTIINHQVVNKLVQLINQSLTNKQIKQTLRSGQLTRMSEKKDTPSDYHYKIVLVGDSGVGKSNIISRFTKNQFNLQSKTTIGVEFATKTLTIQGKTVKVQIWDTAGQQRYRSMASAYYRGANGALLVYDITRSTSFQNLQKWVKELKNYGSQDIVCLLIGNKADLKNYRSLKQQHGQQYAKNNNMGFFETSAMEGSNIDQAFNLMVSQILKRTKSAPKKETNAPVFKKQSLHIQNTKPVKKNCCS